MSTLFIRGVLGLALAAASLPALADPVWSVRSWQSDAGLPDNTVVGIGQAPDGFLWVASQTGLARFDGVQFRQFPVKAAGVSLGTIFALCVDRKGRLWVAKERGAVVCMEQGRTTVWVAPDRERLDRRVRMMVEDGEGALWVSYNGGEVVRIQEGRVRIFTVEDGLQGEGTCELTVDGKGFLWFCRSGWVGVFREGQFHSVERSAFERIAGLRSGGIWACTREQLFKFDADGAGEKVFDLPAEASDKGPTALCEASDGRLWIGTREAGLFTYGREGFVAVPVRQQTILSVTEDREGTIWVGTRGGGLNRLTPRLAELLTTSASAPFEAVRSVCQDTDGKLWAVVWQKGAVLRRTGSDWTPLTASDGWTVPYAQCVAADPAGGVWIGTEYNGLHLWRDGAVAARFDETNGLTGQCVGALLATPSGEVWIGARNRGDNRMALQRLRSGQFRTFPLPAGCGTVAALATDASGDCWAGTSRGRLLRVREDVLTDETASILAGAGVIRSLLATPDGSLWIGYAGEGLGRLKAGRFSRCRIEQGLHDDYISQILPDGRGRLWFAGNRGIFSVRETELDELAEGQASRVRSVAYGQREGLPSLQASYDAWPSSLCGTDGRLFFAMQSGVAAVYAADLKELPEPPPVVIERVTANTRTVALCGAGEAAPAGRADAPLELAQAGAHLRLAPGSRQLEFAFTGLSFMMPETVGFRYRLQGLDADWTEAGTRRTVSYAQLPPGHYHFQVTACNRDGRWNETGASLPLTLDPYWWETAWFRVAGPLAAAGLIGGWVFLWLRRRHRHFIERLELRQATERERVRIAQDLHDDLGAGLTQISLNTAMVKNPAVSPEVASGLLQEIDQRSRELVTALDEIVWAVNPKNDTVPSLARYFCQFAQNSLLPSGIVCRLEVAQDLPDVPLAAEQRHNLFLAFKEALHNTQRHSGADQLRLVIAAGAQTLSVTLADNGRGFAQGHAAEGADGLGNMRARLARLGGSCTVTSGPGQGTTVVFSLPIGRSKA